MMLTVTGLFPSYKLAKRDGSVAARRTVGLPSLSLFSVGCGLAP